MELILGDCLTKMQSFEKESIDLIFTSPPYNLGEPVKHSMFAGNRGEKLAYNKYSDTLPEHEYIRWQHDILKTCYSLIKDTDAIFYNHKPRIKNKIYDDRRNLIPFNIRQEIIWDTTSLFNFNGWFFVPHTERIFIIAKDNWKPDREFVSCGEIWKFPPTPSKNIRRPSLCNSLKEWFCLPVMKVIQFLIHSWGSVLLESPAHKQEEILLVLRLMKSIFQSQKRKLMMQRNSQNLYSKRSLKIAGTAIKRFSPTYLPLLAGAENW